MINLQNINCHSAKTYCVEFFKNWIITGSDDCTIRIWDNGTFQCLRILGNINQEILNHRLSDNQLLELIENNDAIFHFGTVIHMDINDKYLVSGSLDGSCIIWKSSDFKPIHRLILSQSNYLISVCFIQ